MMSKGGIGQNILREMKEDFHEEIPVPKIKELLNEVKTKMMSKEEQKKLVSKLLKVSNDIHKKGLGQANHISLSEKFIQQQADEKGVTFGEMVKIIEEELKFKQNNDE